MILPPPPRWLAMAATGEAGLVFPPYLERPFSDDDISFSHLRDCSAVTGNGLHTTGGLKACLQSHSRSTVTIYNHIDSYDNVVLRVSVPYVARSYRINLSFTGDLHSLYRKTKVNFGSVLKIKEWKSSRIRSVNEAQSLSYGNEVSMKNTLLTLRPGYTASLVVDPLTRAQLPPRGSLTCSFQDSKVRLWLPSTSGRAYMNTKVTGNDPIVDSSYTVDLDNQYSDPSVSLAYGSFNSYYYSNHTSSYLAKQREGHWYGTVGSRSEGSLRFIGHVTIDGVQPVSSRLITSTATRDQLIDAACDRVIVEEMSGANARLFFHLSSQGSI